MRLIVAGWEGRQELRAIIEQQGLAGLRRLYRQRTRWAQGNLQAMRLIGPRLWRAPLPLAARLEQCAYLLMPLWQADRRHPRSSPPSAFVATGQSAFWLAAPWWQVLFVYLLGFGGTMLGCVASRAGTGLRGVIVGLLVAQVYAFYSWLLWPVLFARRAAPDDAPTRLGEDPAGAARSRPRPGGDTPGGVMGGRGRVAAPRPATGVVSEPGTADRGPPPSRGGAGA